MASPVTPTPGSSGENSVIPEQPKQGSAGYLQDPTGWGNQVASSHQVLGARQVFWRLFFLFLMEPVYAFLQDTLYISQSLYDQLRQPFKPKLIHNFSYNYQPNTGNYYNLQFCSAKEKSKILWFTVPVPSRGYKWGGIFCLSEIIAPSKFFSIKGQYGQTASMITVDGKVDAPNLTNEGDVCEDLRARAKLVADRTYHNISAFGFIFKGAVNLDSQNAATLGKGQTHISVTTKLPNDITHLNTLVMFTCRHPMIELLLVKLKDDAIEHLSKFYTVKGAIQFLEGLSISQDNIQNIIANCLISVDDIIAHSPFESALCIIPLLNKQDAYAFLLTPAIIAELKVRYHIANCSTHVE
jgi:hypothetical protein